MYRQPSNSRPNLNLYCYPLVWAHAHPGEVANDAQYRQARLIGSPYCERLGVPYVQSPKHRHHGHELLVVTHGTCQIVIEDADSYTLAPGSVLIIPGGNGHYRIVNEPVCCCGIELSPDYFYDRQAWALLSRNVMDRQALDERAAIHVPGQSSLSKLGGHYRGKLASLIQGYGRRMFEVSTDHGVENIKLIGEPLPVRLCRDLHTSSTFFNLFEECLTAYSQVSPLRAHMINAFGPLFALFLLNLGIQTQLSATSQQTVQRILDIKRWLDRHYAEEITVAFMAEKANLSPHWFGDAFRKTIGLSPKAYLISLRLEHAAHLLVETEYSVTDIAQRVGYADLSNFIRAFEKRYHLSPHTYRQQHGHNIRM